ncbi:MAG: hypothetical protein VXY93_14025, partial [Pseudomonadota bacterium]|nr:hypothetical protein [Pseudomonadota bacterium]
NVAGNGDLQLVHTGTYSNIYNATGDLDISSNVIRLKNANRSKTHAAFINNGQSEFYYDNSRKFYTSPTGITVSGSAHVTGSIDLDGDIDVDGHTNLDNVSVAGVTTFSDSDIFFKNSGITSCKFDSSQGQFQFNNAGGLFWYKNGNLSNSSGAVIYYSENAVPYGYGGLIIQAPWTGQTNAKNIKVMGSSNGYFSIQSNLNASETFRATFQGGVTLGYYQSGTKLSTTQTGITLHQDLDVDGHTNLDNVSIAGVTTMSGNLSLESTYPRIFLKDT